MIRTRGRTAVHAALDVRREITVQRHRWHVEVVVQVAHLVLNERDERRGHDRQAFGDDRRELQFANFVQASCE